MKLHLLFCINKNTSSTPTSKNVHQNQIAGTIGWEIRTMLGFIEQVESFNFGSKTNYTTMLIGGLILVVLQAQDLLHCLTFR
jgi:hypothetical protein